VLWNSWNNRWNSAYNSPERAESLTENAFFVSCFTGAHSKLCTPVSGHKKSNGLEGSESGPPSRLRVAVLRLRVPVPRDKMGRDYAWCGAGVKYFVGVIGVKDCGGVGLERHRINGAGAWRLMPLLHGPKASRPAVSGILPATALVRPCTSEAAPSGRSKAPHPALSRASRGRGF
jgi:hypothetical protein